ncbi:hypothetical protein [Rhizobium bangladeshense]|nr:hypothetical protein [Rhizobium bangladeshense]
MREFASRSERLTDGGHVANDLICFYRDRLQCGIEVVTVDPSWVT